MNMNKSLLIVGAAGVLALCGCQGKGVDDDRDDNEATISMSQVPPAVQASFEKMHPNATVLSVEKETHADGTAEYEYTFTQDGKKREVELNEKGAVVAEDED